MHEIWASVKVKTLGSCWSQKWMKSELQSRWKLWTPGMAPFWGQETISMGPGDVPKYPKEVSAKKNQRLLLMFPPMYNGIQALDLILWVGPPGVSHEAVNCKYIWQHPKHPKMLITVKILVQGQTCVNSYCQKCSTPVLNTNPVMRLCVGDEEAELGVWGGQAPDWSTIGC